ncbi:hypothetical protein [Saccharopolyspora phatthalungensis]|uniref:Lipoprotein n=1 Tax=Saccharopolyspora phatthalungensis TaxID=664693 RepID=A0A840Q6Z9_9PSEU|nr:hypothetical protein [Saccharopolyspora phatthalungensis]MBB5156434.1 hypothetical protein [Saccharopolyspora phatthalungensis]
MKISTSLRRVVVLASLGLLAAGCAGNPNLDPAHDRYKALPRICDLVSPATASRVIGTSLQTDALSVETTGYCAWTYRDLGSEGAHAMERRLSLHVSLHRSSDTRSGSDGALEELDRLSEDSPNHFERVLGFGEYAVRSITPGGVDYIIVVGNLNLKVGYSGRDVDSAGRMAPMPREQAAEQAEVLAREVAANTART